MGVAVITSTSGRRPFCPSACRWRTPKRCCSSMSTSPSRSKETPSWISAWVPTATRAVDSTAARRALASARAASGDQRDLHPIDWK